MAVAQKRTFLQWVEFCLEKFGEGICAIGAFLKKNWRLSFELRKVVMAVPVVLVMLRLADECRKRLPETVGINLLANGNFERLMALETAISYMMSITIGCLVLMFFSRKTIYPWLISIFSLALPILLIVTNVFPG
jgi:hypothetical protein